MYPKHLSRSRFFVAAAVCSLLVLLAAWDPQPVSSAFRSTFHTLLWPVEKVFSGLAGFAKGATDVVSSIGELNRENELLMEENLRLKAENAELGFLRIENEDLRRASGFDIRGAFDLVPTQVIALGGESGTVIIDKGFAQGIREGMPIVVGGGVLVGTVDESYPVSSRVKLLSNSQSSVGGVTVGGGAQGVVRGLRGLGIAFGMVPQTDSLENGDRVVTSGVGGNIPSGLLIGTVDRVQESSDRLTREGVVITPVDFSRLRFLFCIRSEKHQ